MATHLEIEMQGRSSAVALEDELKQLYPLAVGRHGVWHVELELAEKDEVAAALATTEEWLRAHDGETAVVRVS